MNTIVQEEGLFSLLKSVEFNFADNFPSKTSYFSEISLSRSPKGGCAGSFTVDFGNMVRDASKNKWLWRSPVAKKTLMNLAKIASLTISKRRPSLQFGRDELFGKKEKNDAATETIELVAKSLDDVPGKFKGGVRSDINISSTIKQLRGRVREVNLVTDSTSSGIRSFMFSDDDAKNNVNGVYQYGVDVQVTDPSGPYLDNILRSMAEARKIFTQYHYKATNRRNFNFITHQFSQGFAKTVNTSSLLNVIEKYVNTLNILSSGPLVNFNNLALKLYTLICPTNGTPENVSKMIDLIDLLIRQLEQLTGKGNKRYRAIDVSRLGEVTAKFKTDIKFMSEGYKTWSEQHFDVSIGKDIGLHYLNQLNLAGTGHPHMTWANFSDHIGKQMLKFFPSTTPTTLVKGININLDASKYSFLSPSTISSATANDPAIIDFFKPNDIAEYNSALIEMIRFNKNKHLAKKTQSLKPNKVFTQSEQYLRDNVIELFATQNCTVVHPALSGTPQTKYEQVSVIDKNTISTIEKFSSDVISNLRTADKYENIKVNPNNVLTKLARYQIANSPAFELKSYDANNIDFNLNQSQFNSLPTSIKALFAIKSGRYRHIPGFQSFEEAQSAGFPSFHGPSPAFPSGAPHTPGGQSFEEAQAAAFGSGFGEPPPGPEGAPHAPPGFGPRRASARLPWFPRLTWFPRFPHRGRCIWLYLFYFFECSTN